MTALKMAVMIFPGADDLDVVGPYEVLKAAELEGAPLRVQLASLNAPEELATTHGMNLHVTERLTLANRPDWLIVPGGGWRNRAEQGVWGEVQRGELPRRLQEFFAAGTKLAAICTGSLLLAAGGLLHDRPASTHHTAFADLEAYGAELIKARVVDDEDIVTAGGVTSGIDLALWLLEKLCGRAIADKGAERMEYQRQGEVWRRNAPQGS